MPTGPFSSWTYEEQAAHLRGEHAIVAKGIPTTPEQVAEFRDSFTATHDGAHDGTARIGRPPGHTHSPAADVVPNWQAASLRLAERLGWEEAQSDVTTNVCDIVGFFDSALDDAYESGRSAGQRSRRAAVPEGCG